MVERPIKKSEREAAKQAEPEQKAVSNVPRPIKKGDRKPEEAGSSESGAEPGHSNRGGKGDQDKGQDRGRSKGRGKGKGRDYDDAPKAPANPALVRGPKPSAKVETPVEAPVEAPEPPTDEAIDEVAEVAEVTESTEVTESAAEESIPEIGAEVVTEIAPETLASSETADS